MKLALCIPGRKFTGRFLESFTNLIKYLDGENIDWILCRRYHPNIYRVRQECLRIAKSHNPDYYMWIDSDMTFTVEDFKLLLENRDKKIISGLYLQPEGTSINDIPISYACFYEGKNRLLTSQVFNITTPISVRANGMGWMLVAKEVFDSVNGPFDQTHSGVSEDIIFQDKAKEKNYLSWIDPRIKLGHEKSVILN